MTVEHVDVLVVGAGISGIGAAYHLQDQSPERSFLVLEGQDGFGGTWRTHRYPGTRSDSDLHTFGYRFKPWIGKPIASRASIMAYLGEVIDENGLADRIRYGHRIESARWSTADRHWTITATRVDDDHPDGAPVTLTCSFLWMCQGYYDHDRPYTPRWDGMDDFAGTVVHPQRWPDDLDCTGKRVVVIGSGATAATIVPALAGTAAHVTMLQRSPTYFIARENGNELVDQLRDLEIPEEWIHEIARRQAVKMQREVSWAAKEFPDMVRDELFTRAKEILPDDFDFDRHFNPTYRPWQQRLALLPDGDLFHAIADGHASVVTDTIERFTPDGIEVASGDVVEADVIVTATGFDLCVLGGIEFHVDDEPLVFADTVSWHGAMFTGVPNLVWVFGYFRLSWTLKVDLLADFVVRLLAHLDERDATMVVPTLRPEDAAMERRPWVEAEDFNPGYLQRSLHLMPSQGSYDPWLHRQDYPVEKELLPTWDLDDGTLRFA